MTVECTRCKAQNPEGKRFCGDCGAALDSAFDTKEAAGPWLRDRVNEVIKEQYKDQRIVEIETAQAIASRLSDWAKLLGFFVGIPVTALLLILGALGISTYSDFSKKIEKAQIDAVARLTDAQTQAANLKTNAESIAKNYEELNLRYPSIKALADKLDTVAKQVDALEKLRFTSSSGPSVAIKTELEAGFAKFQQYFISLGYRSTTGTVSVDIREIREIMDVPAYYDLANRTMVIDIKYAPDLFVLYRAYTHHVLYSFNIPSYTQLWILYAIEQGLERYFPCSYVDNPKPASKMPLDLTTKLKLSGLKPNVDEASKAGEIWASTFWEIRETLGQQAADKLLFDAWFTLHAEEIKSDSGESFIAKLFDVDRAHESQIRAIFAGRGLLM